MLGTYYLLVRAETDQSGRSGLRKSSLLFDLEPPPLLVCMGWMIPGRLRACGREKRAYQGRKRRPAIENIEYIIILHRSSEVFRPSIQITEW